MRRFINELQRSPSARRLNFTALAHRVGCAASNSTVSRYLKRHGFRRCRAKVKPFLKEVTRQKRLEFAQAHVHWDAVDWARVIWTDECAFHHGGHQRIFVTRRPEERFNLECLAPRFERIPHTMVWGAICGTEKGPLIFWDKKDWGNITAASFCEYIFPDRYDFWLDVIQSDPETPFYIMMDNTPPHTAKTTQRAFEQASILLLPWPPSSPDLNPIKNIWGMIKDRINARQPRLTKKEEILAAIQEEWDRISGRELDNLISSMPTRIQQVIKARGGPTKW